MFKKLTLISLILLSSCLTLKARDIEQLFPTLSGLFPSLDLGIGHAF